MALLSLPVDGDALLSIISGVVLLAPPTARFIGFLIPPFCSPQFSSSRSSEGNSSEIDNEDNFEVRFLNIRSDGDTYGKYIIV